MTTLRAILTSASRAALIAALAFAMLSGCRGQTSREPPLGWIRNMWNQARYNPQSHSRYFQDGRTMRQPMAHTVAIEEEPDLAIDTGVAPDGSYLMTIPQPVIDGHGRAMARDMRMPEETRPLEALTRRGQDRYGIYCVPCHGGLGDGQGMVPEVSGVPTIRPPTFHEDRIRNMPDGQLYATIRNGQRNMPSYMAQIPVRDRWAIVAYVRALQLDQMDRRTAMAEPPR